MASHGWRSMGRSVLAAGASQSVSEVSSTIESPHSIECGSAKFMALGLITNNDDNHLMSIYGCNTDGPRPSNADTYMNTLLGVITLSVSESISISSGRFGTQEDAEWASIRSFTDTDTGYQITAGNAASVKTKVMGVAAVLGDVSQGPLVGITDLEHGTGSDQLMDLPGSYRSECYYSLKGSSAADPGVANLNGPAFFAVPCGMFQMIQVAITNADSSVESVMYPMAMMIE